MSSQTNKSYKQKQTPSVSTIFESQPQRSSSTKDSKNHTGRSSNTTHWIDYNKVSTDVGFTGDDFGLL